jgi:signal transduction histidine kinase
LARRQGSAVEAVGFPRFGLARLAAIVIRALAYAALARMGLALDAVSGFATLVWPPTGLSVAALWLYGLELWPGVLLGAFVANATAGAPLGIAAAIAGGNTLEAVVAVLVLRRARFHPALERMRDVLALVGLAGLAVPLVSAAVGVTSLWIGGLVKPAELAVTLRSWWIGDALGVLVVTPVLLTWLQRQLLVPAAPPRAPRLLERAALVVVAAALALLLFGFPTGPGQPFRQPFILFPLVVWAAVRMRVRAVTAMVLFLSGAAVAGTALGHGPFARDRLAEGLAALQVFTAMLALGGLVLGALVAERIRAEQALAEAVRVRDEFVSVASHELRTPLSVLSLDLERLAKVVEGLPDANDSPVAGKGDRLRRSLRQVGRLNFLVENLLGASSIAHGRLRMQPKGCDLSALAGEVVTSFAGDPARGERPIDLQVPGPIPGQWDPQLVEQAITNLISNAVKYGQGQPVTVNVRADGDRARVEVVDRGIGIQAQDLERIFGGLGLGLYITRQIAEVHGGRVLVSSTPGKGSTFVLELPRVKAPDAPAGSGPAPA